MASLRSVEAVTTFTHDGRSYTFERQGNEYQIIRSDGLIAWDTYKTSVSRIPYHAYRPAIATVADCKAIIRGEGQSTFVSHLVFAASAADAVRIREQEDADTKT